MHIIEESGKAEKGRRLDAFVQSTDKNLMVPVGGSIISGYDSEFVRNISKNYPGNCFCIVGLMSMDAVIDKSYC